MNAPLECIIRKCENSTVDWKEGMSGNRSVIFREQDFKETGKRDFMNQLMELEMEGLVKVKWYQYGIEAEKAWYSLEQMETIPTSGKNTEVQACQCTERRGGPTACFDTEPVDTQLLPILSPKSG